MKSKFIIFARVCGVISLALPTAPAAAQDYEAIVRLMRECAKIERLEDRAACYDKTIDAERLVNGASAKPKAPQPKGFGAESLPEPAAVRAAAVDKVELGVRQADRVEPGIYVLTLEDGSRWRFVDAVPMAYDPPRAGSRIELARAALGSFQMRFANQRAVRIRRVQ